MKNTAQMQGILDALVYVIPAYLANGAPVVVARLLGGGHPLDLGARLWDGRRLLGDGKTLEGLVSGLVAGLIAAYILDVSLTRLYRGFIEAALLPVGAMLGDMFGSFTKRRIGLERGRSAPLLDQLSFLAAALILSWLPYGPPSWATPDTILILALITVLLHVSTNTLAYLAGLKEEWY